jgi:hypothetical protein
MSRKKEFTTGGREGMLIDCDDYEVEIFKNYDKEVYSNTIKFTHKESKNTMPLNYAFIIDWDKSEDGGKLSIKYRDRWGSEMVFIHYEPSDLKGMFDFIGRGYGIFEKINKKHGN